jgi:hypothetical protein
MPTRAPGRATRTISASAAGRSSSIISKELMLRTPSKVSAANGSSWARDVSAMTRCATPAAAARLDIFPAVPGLQGKRRHVPRLGEDRRVLAGPAAHLKNAHSGAQAQRVDEGEGHVQSAGPQNGRLVHGRERIRTLHRARSPRCVQLYSATRQSEAPSGHLHAGQHR